MNLAIESFRLLMVGHLAIRISAHLAPYSSYEDSIVWSITPIKGSNLTYYPTSRKYRTMQFTYKILPDSNKYFGYKYIKATLSRFGLADSVLVEVFFLKNANNHPIGNMKGPNWYYYWRQTPASFGNPNYSGPDCNSTKAGYYKFSEPYFHVCDNACEGDSSICSQSHWTGIDLFAATCRHEERHLLDYFDWWDSLGHNLYSRALDSDIDLVRNSVEPSLIPWCDSTKWDTDGDGWQDFEDRGFDRECDWLQGQADSLDWANPGHQY